MNEDMESELYELFGPVISEYSRAQAIEDGTLVDVSETAREAGIKYPVALTRAVWAEYVEVPEGVEGQDERGRLWDLLWMYRAHARGSLRPMRLGPSAMLYTLLVRNDHKPPRRVTLKAICGPGDTAEPVITILLPEED